MAAGGDPSGAVEAVVKATYAQDARSAETPPVYLPLAARDAATAQATIGPEGGRLTLDVGHAEHVELRVPAGALARPTTIWLRTGRPVDSPLSRPLGAPVEIGPHGLALARPAELRLAFDAALLPPDALAERLVVARRHEASGAIAHHPPDAREGARLHLDLEGFSTFQAHLLEEADGGECPAAEPPAGCQALTPTEGAPGPLVVDGCRIVGAGRYDVSELNVVDGGTLYFQDEGALIDLRVRSLLVEQGGRIQAGAWCRPFGSAGGRLSIGLWGDDPTDEGRTSPPTRPAIDCRGPDGSGGCYAAARVDAASPSYCLGGDPADPCAETRPAPGDPALANAFFEGYGDLNYDDSPFGHKVLAVSYGGSVELFGRRGVAPEHLVDPDADPDAAACAVPAADERSDPAAWAALSGGGWARLDATAEAGQDGIQLDRPVDWAPGDLIVVAATGWHASQSELAEVVANDGAGGIRLAAPLAHSHWGALHRVSEKARAGTDNPNAEIETRAAVGLLSRSITIRSLGASPNEAFPEAAACGAGGDPGCYFGGHVIVRQGFGRFQAQGVELRQLGQGGRMGHYPLHFHMAKDSGYTNAFLKDSSVWDSMNRFVTIHATHDVTLARNVGFLSVGHGYYLEDGSEIRNRLCHNLGVSARGALEEHYAAQPDKSPTHRRVPPILDGSLPSADAPPSAARIYGSDAYFPVMYWTMNAYNDLVGNQAVGVGGYGACYWLLGAGLSGPSRELRWAAGTGGPADYAGFNEAGQRQAPVLRFRGNGCGTAPYALQTTQQVAPTSPAQTGFTAVANPYLQTDAPFMRPIVDGDFLPLRAGANPDCQNGLPAPSDGGEPDFSANAAGCAATVIDRFTASFTWAETNFGAVWLRPRWYVFSNGAITDVLFGGLGFVSGGSWGQLPPGYFTLVKDSLFVGDSRGDAAGPHDGPLGPRLEAADCPDGSLPCLSALDGTGFFRGGFNAKRLISIYDGPFYAEGNVFEAVAPIDCDAADLASCGVYLTTVQPAAADEGSGMRVMNAAIGWKQPNAFYYPPAFAFRKSGFDADALRHAVLDAYEDYIQGAVGNGQVGAPQRFSPLGETYVGVTPADFSTILNDLDGSVTGMAHAGGARTSSVSRNRFFDAPSQADECLSFGVVTSPHDYVTTVAAPTYAAEDGTRYTDPTLWLAGGPDPAVPIYRQLALDGDAASADGAVCDGPTWAHARGSFMAGGQNGQAPYLTVDGGTYFIDAAPQATSCVPNPDYHAPGLLGGSSYVLYQLFARSDTRVDYQIPVGEGYDPAGGAWVRVQPHVFDPLKGGNAMRILPFHGPAGEARLEGGVLHLTLDNAAIASDFAFAARDEEERCLPRDLCRVADDGAGCTVAAALADDPLAPALEAACAFWATLTSGEAEGTEGLALVDCPAGGCLGYLFTMPGDASTVPPSYAEAGAPLLRCYPDDESWDVPLSRLDLRCPAPPPPAGYCQDGGV